MVAAVVVAVVVVSLLSMQVAVAVAVAAVAVAVVISLPSTKTEVGFTGFVVIGPNYSNIQRYGFPIRQAGRMVDRPE